MHISLTDTITCPRCGPDYGLVLLADRVENRRILDGAFGCSNCRERYRVQGGFADFRYSSPNVEAQGQADPGRDAVRLAALLGVTEGPATLLIVGAGAADAAAISQMIADVEVVAISAALAAEEEKEGVSRAAIGSSAHLPFRSRSMRAVALTDEASLAYVAEAARVAGPNTRIVVQSSSEHVARTLEESGVRIVARDAQTIVAERGVF